jgi:hypothetical protein
MKSRKVEFLCYFLSVMPLVEVQECDDHQLMLSQVRRKVRLCEECCNCIGIGLAQHVKKL